jgi:hypothetical protein
MADSINNINRISLYYLLINFGMTNFGMTNFGTPGYWTHLGLAENQVGQAWVSLGRCCAGLGQQYLATGNTLD